MNGIPRFKLVRTNKLVQMPKSPNKKINEPHEYLSTKYNNTSVLTEEYRQMIEWTFNGIKKQSLWGPSTGEEFECQCL
ncbi:9025_t:CDS:2 [Acaulospora morrowiae]|uniref:9025_t:CDS:1 n=1 Tax=Acaulospora morrowiae TaxID=94023 RepID=A0A9N8V5Y0_9GLOM|nr:9025_t:CDS:2 [Acaulospora morrowiae]